MLHYLAALTGPGLPVWLYEFATLFAAALGAAFSAVRGAVARTRNRDADVMMYVEPGARSSPAGLIAVALIVLAAATMFAVPRLRESLDSTHAVEVLHIVTIIVMLIVGNFVHSAFSTKRWRALISAPALLLYAVVAFDYWYQHRASPAAAATTEIQDVSPVERSTAQSPGPVRRKDGHAAASLDRVGRELESKSSRTRMRALNEATRPGGDATIRSFALARAFGSSDDSLRSTALREVLRSSSSLTIVIDETSPYRDAIEASIGNVVRMHLLDRGDAAGRFRISGSVPHATGLLTVSKKSISFTVPAGTMSATPVQCEGHETLQSGDSELRGTMHCTVNLWNVRWSSSYDVMTDLL